MANSPFLTTFARHRDPKLLWPVAAVASVLTHGLALGMVRTLSIQTPAQPEGEMAPLPIQLVDLSADQGAPGLSSADPEAAVDDDASTAAAVEADAATPLAAQTAPTAEVPAITPLPPSAEAPVSLPPQPAAPPVDSPPVAPAPPPTPAPVTSGPPVAPAPPRPQPQGAPAPAVSRPPGTEVQPGVDNPSPGAPPPSAPPGNAAPGGSGAEGQGGQVVPVGIRLDPNGRDIPETAPQLLNTSAIAMRPLASSCGFANLDALLAGVPAASVQMQIRVEPSGEISNVRLLQGTGSSAVDDLVSCVVRQRLRLQPASSAGVSQLTDAFILDAQIQF
ncbi:MAG: TonB C-terminal domain-containing protein [Nodosilinea sp. WJT8-NPBG4]|nr:TonB C-terminal domain-containing protein [Nodosilinea sp. WJT8-NPBG4]